ncbi:MAG: hypothetical protein JSV91_12120 [Phycisphaerales bacterium]|nr:MAG: hypothetical protein JSV91_12120 [Phycisphaerales bacterium]
MRTVQGENVAIARPAALASFFANGFLAQIAQILLLRELLVVLDGDELAVGIMLAAWLCFAALGALLARQKRNGHPPLAGFAIMIAITALSLPGALIVVRLARPFFDAPLGTPLGLVDSLLLAAAAAAVPCICIGMLFPLMVRVANSRPALVYGGEAAGALAAGLLFVFVFVAHLSPIAIASIAGGLAAAAALVLIVTARPSHRVTAGAMTVLLLLAVFGAIFGGRFDNALEQHRWRRQLPDHDLLSVTESPYGRYTLLRSASQFSLFLDGHLQCDIPDPYGTGWIVHTVLLQHPNPRSVLIIGNALGGNVAQALLHRPQRIDCVELDPAPLRTLKQHAPGSALSAFDDPSVKVHYVDPIALLGETARNYDAILLDLPDPTTLGISRLYSREFLEICFDHLSDGGVLSIGISSQANYLGPYVRQRNALVYHTIRAILTDAVATPGDHCLIIARSGQARETADAGSQSSLTLAEDELAHRLTQRGIDWPAYLSFLYSDPFPIDRQITVNGSLAAWPAAAPESSIDDLMFAMDEAPTLPQLNNTATINTDLHPRAYWLTRVLNTVKFDRPAVAVVIEGSPIVVSRALGVVVAGIAVASIILRAFARATQRLPATGAGLTLASAAFAFAIMTMHLAVLLWYQSRVGQMYIGLALLTAAFMAGMAVGAMWGEMLLRARRSLIAFQVLLVLAALLSPLLWEPASPAAVKLISPLCAALLGALLGGHFACCCAIWKHDRSEPVGAARWLYGADLLGGALAALVVAAVVVPGFGLVAAVRWAGIFALAALIATVLLTRSRCDSHAPS